jgi:hypothetical protein
MHLRLDVNREFTPAPGDYWQWLPIPIRVKGGNLYPYASPSSLSGIFFSHIPAWRIKDMHGGRRGLGSVNEGDGEEKGEDECAAKKVVHCF